MCCLLTKKGRWSCHLAHRGSFRELLGAADAAATLFKENPPPPPPPQHHWHFARYQMHGCPRWREWGSVTATSGPLPGLSHCHFNKLPVRRSANIGGLPVVAAPTVAVHFISSRLLTPKLFLPLLFTARDPSPGHAAQCHGDDTKVNSSTRAQEKSDEMAPASVA